MINIGSSPLMTLLAIIAALGGVGLYFVRNFRPELARDHDIFLSAIALFYGIILLVFNFRMEITTQLAQVLAVGFAGWFVVESLVLRQALANQDFRETSSPLVNDEDTVNFDYYRAESNLTRGIGMGLINSLTRLCCGVGVIDIRDRANQTKDFLIKSEERAKTRRLKEAIQLAKSGTRLWSQNPNFWEQLFRKWFLSDLLFKLEESLKKWSGQMQNAQRLIQEGNNLLALVSDDPKEYENLEKGLHCLQRAKNLLFDPKVNEQVKSYNFELQQRKKWLELFEDAQANALAKYFQKALPIYEEAQNLYSTDELNNLIAVCKSGAISEKQYCQELKNAKSFCQQADFLNAFKVARMAVASFPREDGQKFLRSLTNILEAKTIFQKGLQHEQSNELDLALDCYTKAYKQMTELVDFYMENKIISLDSYTEAYSLMPDLLESRFRQVIVACKQKNWKQALVFLYGLNGDRASYLRGFIFAKQQNYEGTEREWQNIRSTELDTQRSKLKIIKQKAYFLDLQAIEKFVDQGDLEKAANISKQALERHPQAEVIRENLEDHILPRLDSEAWKQTEINWNTLLGKTRSIWLERPSLKSLHNWAVAAYYCSMNIDYPKLDLMMEFNASWGTAIANLSDDPSLSNLPWLGNVNPDCNQLKQKLEELWDRVLDQVKEHDLNTYMQLRDWQRLDRYTLNILTRSTKPIIKLGSTWILPSNINFLSQFEKLNNNLTKSMLDIQHQYKILSISSQLSLLYSPLGIAIAACLDGDIERGLQLKNYNSGYLNHKEHLNNAHAMLSYFESCHLLKKNQWQNALQLAKQFKQLIQKNPEWLSEIDRLCESVVRGLDEKDQITFAKSWLEATSSKAARNYYTECKTEEIRIQLANEKITPRQGLSKLRELTDIDTSNPVYRDIINRIEVILANEEVFQFLKRGETENAVNRAMRSGNREVKQTLAEVLVNILQEADRQGRISHWERMQVVGWITNLVPDLVN